MNCQHREKPLYSNANGFLKRPAVLPCTQVSFLLSSVPRRLFPHYWRSRL